MKTFKEWEESNLDLDQYLEEPCRIDEELYNYIGEVVPSAFKDFENGITQGGDPIFHREGADGNVIQYYMTTLTIDGKYFYIGVLPEFKD